MTVCDPMDCSPPGSELCPLNYPGKNTGVGGHSLFQGIFPTQESNLGLPHCGQTLYHLSHQRSPLLSHENVTHSAVSNSLQLMDCSPPGPRFLWPWNSPGKNAAVGHHSLFQGIFPTQGWNPGLPHCRQMLYPLSHQGSPYPNAYVMPFIFTHTHKQSVSQFNSHIHQATCLIAAEDHWYPLTNFESSYLDENSVQFSHSVMSNSL